MLSTWTINFYKKTLQNTSFDAPQGQLMSRRRCRRSTETASEQLARAFLSGSRRRKTKKRRNGGLQRRGRPHTLTVSRGSSFYPPRCLNSSVLRGKETCKSFKQSLVKTTTQRSGHRGRLFTDWQTERWSLGVGTAHRL